ncbi:IS630 family transposase [Flexibacterium corallicola]|uniref:IS630 family transposase n=1 Tax=Flexibacterium corallicola TaxID=3037259 RepID=UPI00286F0BC7|nr:IS630 family transposase [Pseudovibrio sp. M1P-2-3]
MLAAEQKRADIRHERHVWIARRQPFMKSHLHRLVFIDETSLKTNMVKTTGWAPKGERLLDHAPFGNWNTQTFIAALRHDRLEAPWVINAPMNRQRFERYVETQLTPTLKKGDVVVLDNLSSHKSTNAAKALQAVGAWFLFLPAYSPDLNPIEMAFAKLKTLIRKIAARSYDDLWKAVGQVCDLFSEQECYNFFNAAGYKSD